MKTAWVLRGNYIYLYIHNQKINTVSGYILHFKKNSGRFIFNEKKNLLEILAC